VTERIVDISESPAHLHSRNRLLVVEPEGGAEVTIPYADIAALIVSHPRVTYSQSVLAHLARAGAIFVACDQRHMPVATLLPLAAHHLQSERFALQAAASLPTRKRLWKQIVQAKIRAQARVLREVRGDDRGLNALANRVRSGDPSNVEAQASRRYWQTLFDDPAFRRKRAAMDENRLLNYGYAVLRALVARAICGAGLHPGIGIHHKNRYDPFPLADDLMEPFRPIVDRAVVQISTERGPNPDLDKDTKGALIGALTQRFKLHGEERTLFDILTRLAVSLVKVFQGQEKRLVLPEV